ncbi:MAG: VOC family protein [Clostridia bacterium]
MEIPIDDGEYWLIVTGEGDQEGINGGLMRGSDKDGQRMINTISVPNLDEDLGKVEREGEKVTTEKWRIRMWGCEWIGIWGD